MLSFQNHHVCPFGPSGHSNGMDCTFQSRKQLELHLLSVHQCHLVKDSASGKDRALPVSAQIAQIARNRLLQQSLYDAAVGVVVSRFVSTVSVTLIFDPVTMSN